MDAAQLDASQYKPRKKWPLFLGGFVALLVLLYFIVSSGWFIRSVVVPQVASSLNSELTVADASLSPFSSLTLKGVKLTPRGAETLATISEVKVRYSLFSIMRGTIKVDEAVLDTPVITLVEEPDGTSNLSKFLAGLPPSTPKPTAAPSAPPQVAAKGIVLRNGSARLTRKLAGGGTEVTEVTGLNLSVDQVGNGLTSKLTLALDAAVQKAADQLAAKTAGELSVGLDAKLVPVAVSGSLKTSIGTTAGAFKDFSGFELALATEVTATELKQLRLGFSQRGQALGEVSLSGPYDIAKREARITYAISGIDKRVLGIAGAASGLGFGDTAVAASGRVDLAQFGQLFASYGKVTVDKFSLANTNGVTPVLDLALDYRFSVNLNDQTALAEKVDIGVRQGGRELARGTLDRPMNVAWGKAAPGFREATFSLTVQDLELSDWRTIAGSVVPAGRFGLSAKVTAERDGRLLKLVMDGGVKGLTGDVAGTQLKNLQVTFQAQGAVQDFTEVTLERSSLGLLDQGEPVVSLTAFANYHQQQKNAGLQATVDVSLPRLLRIHPVEGVNLTGGSANVSLQVGLRPGATNTTINFAASGLTGNALGIVLTDYQTRIQLAADVGQNSVTLQRLTFSAQSGTAPGGSLDLAGKFDLRTKAGDFDYKSVGLNESALGPFVAGALAPNRLVSIAIDADGTGVIDLAGESALNTKVRIKNFVAEDAAKTLPTKPLELGFAADMSRKAETIRLKQVSLELGATARAKNELVLDGLFDFATNNAAPSVLNVRSSGLDLTPLYNLFAGTGTNAPTATKPTTAPPTAQDPNQEPAAMNLPLKRFDLDLNIAKVFLREVVVSNWVTKLKLDNNVVTLDPVSLSLNDGPVKARAKANLGVAGYTYDVGFDADAVPLRPLNNTFVPDQVDRIGGTLAAKFETKGAGVTGASLQKNLEGSFNVVTTNLNLAVTSVKSSTLKAVINTVILIPDLIRNPGAAMGNLLGRLTGAQTASSGWVDEITKSPIDTISAQGKMGSGKVNLEGALVRSPAFQATAQGVVTLASVLTNSALQVPVGIALRRELAQKAGMAPANTPTNVAYAALPDFLTLQGTVGKAEPKINYLALAGLAGQMGAGLVGGSGKAVLEQGAGLVQGLGRLVGGGKTNSPTATNAPAGGLGAALGNLLGGPKTTNAPANTNQPQTVNPLDFLKKPEPKK